MKILSATQIRELDAYTITNEPILSINLMERASNAFSNWFMQQYPIQCQVKILCGPGNNGGDGLAIARILNSNGYKTKVYVVHISDKTAEDFQINLERLPKEIKVTILATIDDIPSFTQEDILIDALFGSGLNRPVDGIAASIIKAINISNHVIAVDIPSGLFTDRSNNKSDSIVKAAHTVSFQLPKLAFVLPQNGEFVGEWHLTDIGLHKDAIEQASTSYFYTDEAVAIPYLKKRNKFSHKGTNGHALLIVGSHGMMGAAILSARACLRSGVGKLSIHSPRHANDLIQSTVPEALFSAASDDYMSVTQWTEELLKGYSSIGIGPGLGVNDKITESIHSLLDHSESIPVVMDADGLNNLSTSKGRQLLNHLPKDTILTPHPKEFQKLLNRSWKDDYEKLELLREFAINYHVIVCLKGANTAVALSDGTIHFNSTGNPGMATGGTGDILTGIITALLAQQYPPAHAAIFGVYLHGLAGDLAAKEKSYYAMTASDLYEFLPVAYRTILSKQELYLKQQPGN